MASGLTGAAMSARISLAFNLASNSEISCWHDPRRLRYLKARDVVVCAENLSCLLIAACRISDGGLVPEAELAYIVLC